MIKEIPILFSTAMVMAILEGRKTKTRRIVKDKIRIDKMGNLIMDDLNYGQDSNGPAFWNLIKCKSKWQKGDLLWVRETFRKYCKVDEHGYTRYDQEVIEFAADNPPMINECDGDGCTMFKKDGTEKFISWKPSIHMPKIAARIWLKVESVRVERLQNISEADAVAEGIKRCERADKSGYGYFDYSGTPTPQSYNWSNPVDSFRTLWQSINGPDSWQANPWVWVVSFKVLSTTGKPDLQNLKAIANA